MTLPRNGAFSPIGVDVSARRLTAVQLRRRGGQWHLAGAAQYERRDSDGDLDAHEIAVLAQILDRQGFVGRDVILPVPSDRLRSDLLELPAAAPDGTIGQLARMEIARSHKCNPAAFELATWSLPSAARATDGRHVMAAACTHDDAETVLEPWDDGGLNVVAMDVRALALARVIGPLVRDRAHVSAALDLTWDAAHLAIMLGETVIYDRTLSDSGLRQAHETLKSRLDVESEVVDFAMFRVGFESELKDEWAAWPLLADARGILATHFTSMLDELRVSFSYAQHRYPDHPVSYLFLTGWGATIPGLEDPLGSMVGVEARRIAPAHVFEIGRETSELFAHPGFTVAAGLATFEGDLT